MSDILRELAREAERFSRMTEIHPVALMELLDRLEAIEKSKQDLAAHVDRLSWASENALAIIDARLPDWAEEVESLRAELDNAPETSLAKRDAEQQKIGAASFRHEIMESVQAPFRPHIQGVFDAWLRRQAGGDV